MRVLVVEDNLDIATAIKTMLSRRKFAVDLASDGESGLQYLLRGTYDVAIIDVMLPRRDGFSICRTCARGRHHDAAFDPDGSRRGRRSYPRPRRRGG
jgi:DNA-binding response OmpR family regulator